MGDNNYRNHYYYNQQQQQQQQNVYGSGSNNYNSNMQQQHQRQDDAVFALPSINSLLQVIPQSSSPTNTTHPHSDSSRHGVGTQQQYQQQPQQQSQYQGGAGGYGGYSSNSSSPSLLPPPPNMGHQQQPSYSSSSNYHSRSTNYGPSYGSGGYTSSSSTGNNKTSGLGGGYSTAYSGAVADYGRQSQVRDDTSRYNQPGNGFSVVPSYSSAGGHSRGSSTASWASNHDNNNYPRPPPSTTQATYPNPNTVTTPYDQPKSIKQQYSSSSFDSRRSSADSSVSITRNLSAESYLQNQQQHHYQTETHVPQPPQNYPATASSAAPMVVDEVKVVAPEPIPTKPIPKGFKLCPYFNVTTDGEEGEKIIQSVVFHHKFTEEDADKKMSLDLINGWIEISEFFGCFLPFLKSKYRDTFLHLSDGMRQYMGSVGDEFLRAMDLPVDLIFSGDQIESKDTTLSFIVLLGIIYEDSSLYFRLLVWYLLTPIVQREGSQSHLVELLSDSRQNDYTVYDSFGFIKQNYNIYTIGYALYAYLDYKSEDFEDFLPSKVGVDGSDTDDNILKQFQTKDVDVLGGLRPESRIKILKFLIEQLLKSSDLTEFIDYMFAYGEIKKQTKRDNPQLKVINKELVIIQKDISLLQNHIDDMNMRMDIVKDSDRDREMFDKLQGDIKVLQNAIDSKRRLDTELREKLAGFEREEEFNPEEHQMKIFFIQNQPIGLDRDKNSYWIFQTLRGLYVWNNTVKDWSRYSSTAELDELKNALFTKEEKLIGDYINYWLSKPSKAYMMLDGTEGTLKMDFGRSVNWVKGGVDAIISILRQLLHIIVVPAFNDTRNPRYKHFIKEAYRKIALEAFDNLDESDDESDSESAIKSVHEEADEKDEKEDGETANGESNESATEDKDDQMDTSEGKDTDETNDITKKSDSNTLETNEKEEQEEENKKIEKKKKKRISYLETFEDAKIIVLNIFTIYGLSEPIRKSNAKKVKKSTKHDYSIYPPLIFCFSDHEIESVRVTDLRTIESALIEWYNLLEMASDMDSLAFLLSILLRTIIENVEGEDVYKLNEAEFFTWINGS